MRLACWFRSPAETNFPKASNLSSADYSPPKRGQQSSHGRDASASTRGARTRAGRLCATQNTARDRHANVSLGANRNACLVGRQRASPRSDGSARSGRDFRSGARARLAANCLHHPRSGCAVDSRFPRLREAIAARLATRVFVTPNPCACPGRQASAGGRGSHPERPTAAHCPGRGRVRHGRARDDRDVPPPARGSDAKIFSAAGACSTPGPAPAFWLLPRGDSAQAEFSASTAIPAPSLTPARTRASITSRG